MVNFSQIVDAYPTQHLIYAWTSMPGVVVLDKEMAQFYMKEMTTAVQRVEYVAGESSWSRVYQPCFTSSLTAHKYHICLQRLQICAQII